MANSVFDRPEYKVYRREWDSRRASLLARRGYYDGTAYKMVRQDLNLLWPRLYRNIKPLYMTIGKAVDIDAGIIPNGWAFPEESPDAWTDARDLLWKWSSWKTKGVLYVHYGAVYGASGLKVVDHQDLKRISIVPIDPMRFMLGYSGTYTEEPSISFFVETHQGPDGPYEYAEVTTRETILTFKDGELWGMDGRDPEYPNLLGVIPYKEVPHILTGPGLGNSTYQQAIPMLNEVNGLASQLADIIKKFADPQWAASGVSKSDLNRGDNVWFLPDGASMEALVAQIDISGVQGFIDAISDNVKEVLPELAFEDLRAKDQIATATLELQLAELTFKVKRCRPNYDDGLEWALKLSGKAARYMGISELTPLDDEDLMIDPERPIINQELSLQERLDYMIKSGVPDEAIWDKLGAEEAEITAWKALKQASRDSFMDGLDLAPEDRGTPVGSNQDDSNNPEG